MMKTNPGTLAQRISPAPHANLAQGRVSVSPPVCECVRGCRCCCCCRVKPAAVSSQSNSAPPRNNANLNTTSPGQKQNVTLLFDTSFCRSLSPPFFPSTRECPRCCPPVFTSNTDNAKKSGHVRLRNKKLYKNKIGRELLPLMWRSDVIPVVFSVSQTIFK